MRRRTARAADITVSPEANLFASKDIAYSRSASIPTNFGSTAVSTNIASITYHHTQVKHHCRPQPNLYRHPSHFLVTPLAAGLDPTHRKLGEIAIRLRKPQSPSCLWRRLLPQAYPWGCGKTGWTS